MEYNPLAADAERLAESLGQLPEPMVEPALIVVSGLPGTGKTYFSQKLAERLPFIVLESDALRRVLFPSPDHSPQESSRLFQACHHLIEALLKKGIPVILDATNLAERHREYLYSIADRLGVKLILVSVEASPQVVHERLKARRAGIKVYTYDFKYAEYNQLWIKELGFLPSMSIADLLFNDLKDARGYIMRNGSIKRIV